VPFEFCVKRAKVSSIMCQYGAMDDVPSCANSKINNGVYRDTYGFEGYIVSDCDSVGGFGHFPPHPDATHSAAMGVLGGLDVDCGTSLVVPPFFFPSC
jgi:beta-D-xylosidase 4